MKTARERAEEFIYKHVFTSNEDPIFDELEKLLKEQDKITRHACAEAVSDIDINATDDDAYSSADKAYAACMNAKAV